MNNDRPDPGHLDRAISLALRASQWAQARSLLETKLADQPLDPKARAQLTSVLMRDGKWPDAVASACDEVRLQPENPAPLKRALLLLLKHGDTARGSDYAQSLHLAETASKLPQADGPLLRLAGQVFLRAGRNRDAAGALRHSLRLQPDDSIALAALAETLNAVNDFAGSAEALESLVRLNPGDIDAWRSLVSGRLRAGRNQDAQTAYLEGIALRAPTISQDLIDGLRGLRPSSVSLPQPRLDWAWKMQAAKAAAPLPPRQAWELAVQWGADANQFLLDWLEIYPARWMEIAQRTELRGEPLLATELRKGRGAYLAIGHVGPVMGMPCALCRSGLPFRWVSNVPGIAGGPVYDRLISTKDQTGWSALAAIHGALNSGEALLAAADTDGRRPPRVQFDGQLIRVNETGARLVHWTGAAAFFLDGRWHGDRMIYEIRPMAEPNESESADAYVERWTADYLKMLRSIVQSTPENLNCRGGLWGSVRANDP